MRRAVTRKRGQAGIWSHLGAFCLKMEKAQRERQEKKILKGLMAKDREYLDPGSKPL